MDNPRRYVGKVALITGGASGLGRAAAERLSWEGAAVALADVDADTAASTRVALEEAGGRALDVPCDVTSETDCRSAVERAVEAFGRLDVLITSAGIHGGGLTVVDTEEEVWDRVLDLDLKGAYLISKFAVPEMERAGAGAILHISSIGGLRGQANGTAFQSAKGGLVNLTRHMSVAHAEATIRVNCICPGVVETPLTREWLSDPQRRAGAAAWHPLNRVAEPEEIAAAIAFLCSDEALFITGAILPVDGGYTAAGRR
ncbi:SDR family NAD(P)-dependent oxidoreductase [Candidatus Latescibacterota bacterium]